MSELSVGDKVILKRNEFSRGPIQVFKVVEVDDHDVDVSVLGEGGGCYWLRKTRLIKVGYYG